MKITIVTGPFLPLPPASCGSVERLWFDLGQQFATRGHEVTFVARGHEGQAADETAGGVRYFRRTRFTRTGRLPLDLLKDLLYSVRVLPLLPPADVISTNVFWLPLLIPWLRRRAGKVVVNVQRFPKGQMWLYKRAGRLAAASDAIRDAIARQSPEALRLTRVFPNPVDATAFAPPESPRTWDGPRTIVYTGRLNPEKGLHLLLAAFRKLVEEGRRELRLKIIGPWQRAGGGGGEEYLESLRAAAAGLPAEILPPVHDRAQLAAVLRSAHCYCYPSLAEKGEALPVAPIEAMATGLAPVVSDLDCFRGVVEPGETGWRFDHRGEAPSAAARLAAALAAALDDPARAEAMGRRAAALAREFSNEKVAAAYLRDFQELVYDGHAQHP